MICKSKLQRMIVTSLVVSNLNTIRHFFQSRTDWKEIQEKASVRVLKAIELFEGKTDLKTRISYSLGTEDSSILLIEEILQKLEEKNVAKIKEALEEKTQSSELVPLMESMMNLVSTITSSETKENYLSLHN